MVENACGARHSSLHFLEELIKEVRLHRFDVQVFEGLFQPLSVDGRHRRQRQAEFRFDASAERQRGFDGDGIGFQKQVFEERVKPLVNGQAFLGLSFEIAAH